MEAETKLTIPHPMHSPCRNDSAQPSHKEATSRQSIQESHFIFHNLSIYRRIHKIMPLDQTILHTASNPFEYYSANYTYH
jgi:hypothetical protein